ncbi:hypothetical protein [Bradyrhizobium sp. WSM1417]|uniref:hypothetical protein n=1 Tax=Bradyrhizobium sp. WSM1417 TaxID=754500 RepID=UPI000482C597|nr:hypothetical protein [Bradyrhizobium sp. WSM1417]
MKLIAASIGVFLATTSAASADWQYTKWGMTVDQVVAASKSQMKRCSAVCNKQKTANETALLYGSYQSGDLPFTAFAFFDNQTHKLAIVTLRLDDPSKGNQLIGSLRAKYGEPATNTRSQIMDFMVWRPAGDQIDITRIGFAEDQSYSLSYHPRLTNSNKGL